MASCPAQESLTRNRQAAAGAWPLCAPAQRKRLGRLPSCAFLSSPTRECQHFCNRGDLWSSSYPGCILPRKRRAGQSPLASDTRAFQPVDHKTATELHRSILKNQEAWLSLIDHFENQGNFYPSSSSIC